MVLERPSWTLRRPRRAGVGRLFASRRRATALTGVLIALRTGLASPGDPSACVCPASDSAVAAQPDAPESSRDDSHRRGQPPPRAAACCRPWGFSPLRRFGLRVRVGCVAIQPDGVRTVSGSRRPSLAALVADRVGRVPVPAPKNRRGGRLDAVPGALTPYEESHTRETGPITGDPHPASDRTRDRRCRRMPRALFFHGLFPSEIDDRRVLWTFRCRAVRSISRWWTPRCRATRRGTPVVLTTGTGTSSWTSVDAQGSRPSLDPAAPHARPADRVRWGRRLSGVLCPRSSGDDRERSPWGF